MNNLMSWGLDIWASWHLANKRLLAQDQQPVLWWPCSLTHSRTAVMSSWSTVGEGGPSNPDRPPGLEEEEEGEPNRKFVWPWSTDGMTLLLNSLTPTASSALQNDPPALTTLAPSAWESEGPPQDLHIILNSFYQEKPCFDGTATHPGQALRTSVTVPPLTPRRHLRLLVSPLTNLPWLNNLWLIEKQVTLSL